MPMPRIIVALDFAAADSALAFAARLEPALCRLKVGNELFTRAGPQLVETLVGRGFDVFLDLKFHDIPNTVAAACRAAADLGVWMLNVHAQGGSTMLQAARDALGSHQRPLLIGVTVLTSLDQQTLAETGVTTSIERQVLHLAGLCRTAGLHGVVCSAQEARMLRAALGDDFCLVTPGIRPADGGNRNDQRRVMTPQAALTAGADYLVIGRPITRATDPVQMLQRINDDIAALC